MECLANWFPHSCSSSTQTEPTGWYLGSFFFFLSIQTKHIQCKAWIQPYVGGCLFLKLLFDIDIRPLTTSARCKRTGAGEWWWWWCGHASPSRPGWSDGREGEHKYMPTTGGEGGGDKRGKCSPASETRWKHLFQSRFCICSVAQ